LSLHEHGQFIAGFRAKPGDKPQMNSPSN